MHALTELIERSRLKAFDAWHEAASTHCLYASTPYLDGAIVAASGKFSWGQRAVVQRPDALVMCAYIMYLCMPHSSLHTVQQHGTHQYSNYTTLAIFYSFVAASWCSK